MSDALCECHYPPRCECCDRDVDKVRGSLWGHRSTCSECFSEWYDGSGSVDPIEIGNVVRKKYGLPPRAALEGKP